MKYTVWGTLTAVAVLSAFGGCGYKQNQGEQRANIKPKVFITNFPPSSESVIYTDWDDVNCNQRFDNLPDTYDDVNGDGNYDPDDGDSLTVDDSLIVDWNNNRLLDTQPDEYDDVNLTGKYDCGIDTVTVDWNGNRLYEPLEFSTKDWNQNGRFDFCIDTVWADPATQTRVVSVDTCFLFDRVVDTAIYLSNPRVYWYGTDEDGRVDAFEYAVIPTDSLAPHPAGMPIVRNKNGTVDPGRFVGSSAPALAAVDSLEWTTLLPPNVVHSAEVSLFADIDTSVAVDQFLFVRAIDNLGLRSELQYARYSRQNHAPQSYIDLDTIEVIQPNTQSERVVRPRKYFSLPQSTAKYPGITIGWSGSDSLDFPDEQPPFEFNWVLYGRFDSKDLALPDSNEIVRTNDNLGTPRVEWTDDDRFTFFNLRSGWYVFEVRARDDALVADATPAIARFQVVEPTFDRPFMLLDATGWLNGQLLNVGSYAFREPRTDSLTPDTLRALYESLFSNQGIQFVKPADVWYRWQTNECADCYIPLPDRDILALYKALIIYDEDMLLPLDMDNQIREYESVLTEYMNVGGRVVLIGRNMFARNVAGWTNVADPIEATFTPADWAFNYFGLTRMFFPGHTGVCLDFGADTADFVSTIALDPAFPQVIVDTFLTLKLSQLPAPCIECLDRDGDGSTNWRWIPDVNWMGIDRNRGAAGFYQFNSELPNTSPSQGRIIGARFEFFDRVINRTTYRTAIVSFPLSVMKRDPALRTMVKQLLDYILR